MSLEAEIGAMPLGWGGWSLLFQRMHTSKEDRFCICALLLWFLEACVWGGHAPHLPWVAHCCLPDWFLQMSGGKKIHLPYVHLYPDGENQITNQRTPQVHVIILLSFLHSFLMNVLRCL